MEKVDLILKDVFGIKPGSIEKDFNLRGLEAWDSLAYMGLIARIEHDFDIQLDGEEITKLLSINQIEGILKKRGVF